jgi:hypothetical protein
MTARRAYGLAAGAVVGGAPFWLLVAPWASPGVLPIAAAAAALLSAVAAATPAAWALGVAAGIIASWGTFALFVGNDWRLVPYIVLQSETYYLVAAAALGIGSLIRRRRSRALSHNGSS